MRHRLAEPETGVDDQPLARDAGLGLHPLRDVDGAPSVPPALLLGYAGLSLAQIRLGTRLLGDCLARVLGAA